MWAMAMNSWTSEGWKGDAMLGQEGGVGRPQTGRCKKRNMRVAEDKLMRQDTCLGARGAWPAKSERGQREVGAWPAALGDCKAGRRREKGKWREEANGVWEDRVLSVVNVGPRVERKKRREKEERGRGSVMEADGSNPRLSDYLDGV